MNNIKKRIILASLVCAFTFYSPAFFDCASYEKDTYITASAETSQTQVSFTLESKTISLSQASDSIKLSLYIDNDEYINQGTFKFKYNSDDLELLSIENGSGVVADKGIINKDISTATYSLFCDNTLQSKGASGEIAILTFKIKNPSADKIYPVSVSNSGSIIRFLSDSADNDLTLKPSFNSGAIEIKSQPQQTEGFEWGKNNWNFTNSDDYFDCYSDYYISDDFLNNLLLKCSNTEKESVLELKSYGWGGSCYGLAALSVLAKDGIFDVSSWQNGALNLHDINAPEKDRTESLINYYFLTQVLDYIQQDININFFRDEANKVDELKTLCDNAEITGKPVLFCFHGYFYGFSWGGHAVVAYANETESGTINDFRYTGYIKIYDNNSFEYNSKYNLYYNDNGDWYIPAYEIKSSDEGTIGLFTDDAEYLNKYGYFENNVSSVSDNGFIGELRTAASDMKFKLEKVNADGSPSFNSSISDDEIKFSSDVLSESSENKNAIKALLKDTASGYLYTPDEISDINLTMRYEDVRMKAVSTSASSVKFLPDGCIEISSDAGNFDMQMTLNDDICDIPWYTLEVLGDKSDSAILSKSDKGYILKGDNLNFVKVKAHNDDVKTSVNFGTDSNSAYIYSIDENTIGISVDKDNDGIFESNIDTYMTADINSDKQITSLDALMVLQTVTENIKLNDMQSYCADIDGDGEITSADALKILQYIVGNTEIY